MFSNFLYDFLALFGYDHPVHPVFVHLPTGLSIGAFCFAVWAKISGKKFFLSTAYQMVVLAFIFVFVAIPIGLFDWQRFYGGAWIFEIKMKLALATAYVVLLLCMVSIGRRNPEAKLLPMLYTCGLMAVMGLGFFGGQLVYHGFSPEAPKQYAEGKHIFASHCSGCHRRGENIIMPDLPLRNAPQLKDFNDFIGFLRNPRMPNGSPGPMPKFPDTKLSDEQVKHLYDYLYFAFLTPSRSIR